MDKQVIRGEKMKLDIQKFASGTISLGTSGALEGRVVWSSVSNGSSANTSTVTAYLQVRRTDSYTTTGTWTGNIVINGISENYSIDKSVSNSWVTLKDNYIKTVPHANDGTCKTQVGGGATGPSGTSLSGNTVSYSTLVTLDTIPRYTTTTTWSVADKTETSITLNWKTAETCSQIRYGTSTSSYTTANVNSNSGTVTINGLNETQTYTLYFMPKRKDSGLWGNGSANAWKSLANQKTHPYPYPDITPDFYIGEAVTITLKNPKSRLCDINIYDKDNNLLKTLQTNTTSTGAILNSASEIEDLYQSIPNNKNGTYKVTVSYGGQTRQKNTGKYIVKEEDNLPIFNDFSYQDTNAITTALTGDNTKVILNYSNIRAIVSVLNKAEAKNYATINRYKLLIGEAVEYGTYSEDSIVYIPSSSSSIENITSNIIKLYAEDSRELSTAVTKTAEVIPYTNIQKGNINVVRSGNVGEAVTLSFDGTFWNNSFGNVNNSITNVTYRYKKTNEDDTHWQNGTTTIVPTTNNNDYSFSGSIAGDQGNNGFSVDYSFNIELIVSDALSSTTFTFVLGTGIPTIAIADDGIAIKQPYDDNDNSVLQVNGNINTTGGYFINGSSIIESGSNTNGNYVKYSDGTLICYGSRTFSGVACTYAWGSFYESTSSVDLGSYPYAFYTRPRVSLHCSNSTGSASVWTEQLYNSSNYAKIGTVYVIRPVSSTVGFTLDFIAIGRWKA